MKSSLTDKSKRITQSRIVMSVSRFHFKLRPSLPYRPTSGLPSGVVHDKIFYVVVAIYGGSNNKASVI